jgi:Caspase domain
MPRAITTLLALLAASLLGAVPQGKGRGVFLLELPELHLEVKENATVSLPYHDVSRILLHVRKSPEEVSYGQIHVRLNGQAADTIMTVETDPEGILCDLNLYFRPGFLLQPGRNAVEAWAQSIYGRSWYASFLLDVTDEPESLREIRVETTVSQPGERPPVIELLQPQGPIEDEKQVELRGLVEGGSSMPTLMVGGNQVPLHAGEALAGARGLRLVLGGKAYSFSTRVPLSPGQDSLEMVASDSANNRTRMLIPVIQGTHRVGQRYAVVIGVSRYLDQRLNLRFADRDALAIRDFLVDPKGGGFDPAKVEYLVNGNATAANIRTALFTFLTKPRPNDLVVVYFAGHGAPDPKRPQNYYLLGYDTDVENMGGTAIPMWELQAAFERTVQANIVSLVDACHSEGVGKGLPNLASQAWTQASYGQRRAILTASEINQFSEESDRWGGGHGVFTYYVLRGLEGAADTNRDGRVSVGELFDYVHNHVLAATQGEQAPTALAGVARGLILTGASASAAKSSQVPIPTLADLPAQWGGYR